MNTRYRFSLNQKGLHQREKQGLHPLEVATKLDERRVPGKKCKGCLGTPMGKDTRDCGGERAKKGIESGVASYRDNGLKKRRVRRV